MSARRHGIVEWPKLRHCFVRDVQTWERFFAPGEAFAGPIPAEATEVDFEADYTSDPRGPRVRHLVVTAAPRAPRSVVCRTCGRTYTLDAGQQHWLAWKRLRPWRDCPECRRTRRAA